MRFKEWFAKEITSTACIASFARPIGPMRTRTWPEPVVMMDINKKKMKKK